MKVSLVRVTADPKEAMALAGANCYDSVPSEKIVDHCYKSGHHSVMEFATFHFHIEGVSRSLTHQLVRHRIASYAQRSQRYVIEDNFSYVTPKSVKDKLVYVQVAGHYLSFTYEELMDILQQAYGEYIMQDVPAEDARYILPNACDTVIDVQFNFRELMSFCNLRLCKRSQWEIRQLATEIVKLVTECFPNLKKYLVPKCEVHAPFNFCTEGNPCGKYPTVKDVYRNHLGFGYLVRANLDEDLGII